VKPHNKSTPFFIALACGTARSAKTPVPAPRAAATVPANRTVLPVLRPLFSGTGRFFYGMDIANNPAVITLI
jgi:hypothetical protein